MRDEKTKKEYYLNLQNKESPDSELGVHNYDIMEKRLVGYGDIQKKNIFHRISNGRLINCTMHAIFSLLT